MPSAAPPHSRPEEPEASGVTSGSSESSSAPIGRPEAFTGQGHLDPADTTESHQHQIYSTAVATQRCSCCREVKPATEFHRNRARLSGLHNTCKACAKAKDRARRRLGNCPLCGTETKRGAMVCSRCRKSESVASHTEEYLLRTLERTGFCEVCAGYPWRVQGDTCWLCGTLAGEEETPRPDPYSHPSDYQPFGSV